MGSLLRLIAHDGTTDALTSTTVRLIRALPLMVAAGFAVYGLLLGAALAGGALLAVTLLLVAVLVISGRRGERSAPVVLGRAGNGMVLCAPALLVAYFSFSAGGFFPDSVALGVLALAALLVIRLGVAERPLASIGAGALVPLIGLAGLAVWALVSQLWSHAPGRAMIAFDRDLLYLLTFALCAAVGRTRAGLVWVLRGVALAMTVVAAFALLSRVAPDVLATAPVAQSSGRLAYPLTYWNALGAFCAIAIVLCLHLAAADDRRSVRVLGAGALPVLGATLLLTYSRGALAAGVVGLAVYAVLGRPRGLLSALLAAAPASAIAVKVAYDDTLLTSADPTTPAAVHQGHELALVVIGCVALALVLRALLLALDRRLEGERSPIDRHRRALRNTALGSAAAAIVAAIALGAPGAIDYRVTQFANQAGPVEGALVRNRLTSTSANGRIALWAIAWDSFLAHPLNGAGAETYEIAYFEHRNGASVVVDAHSLYVETLGELGVVGMAFLLMFVLGTLIGLAPFGRGRDRALYAALFGAGLAWALHAGVEWDWQMPAVSLPFVALAGVALARPAWRGASTTIWASARILAVGAIVVAAAVAPALILASQVRLDDARSAYAAGNCARADRLAQRSLDALGTRSPPWQIEALCSVRAHRFRRAAAQLRAGLAHDPEDWRLQVALAAALAAAGSDARTQVAAARRLNPFDNDIRALARAFADGPSHAAARAAIAFLSEQSLIGSG